MDEFVFCTCGQQLFPHDDRWYLRGQCEKCYKKDEAERATTIKEVSREKAARIRDAVNTFLRMTPSTLLQVLGAPPKAAKSAEVNRIKQDGTVNLSGHTMDDKQSLFLHGPSGSGKTVLACALLYHAALRRVETTGHFVPSRFVFVSVPQVLSDYRKSFSKWKEGNVKEPATEHEITHALKSAHCLVLDDLGAEKSSDWTLSALYLVINHRYEHDLPTVFTSNLSLEALAERMDDDRIPTRIDRWCEVIKLAKYIG